jgi:hypothetical protein
MGLGGIDTQPNYLAVIRNRMIDRVEVMTA